MKKVWSVIMTIALLGIVCSLGYIAWNLYTDIKDQEVYEDAQSMVEATPTPTDDSSLTVEDIEKEEFTGVRDGEAPPLPDGIFTGLGNPINFQLLQEINTDLYAWIRMSDVGIDLPIGHNQEDEFFYLNHDMYKNVTRVGCPFTLNYNKTDFSDPNTIVYGHNMETGAMFAPLHQFEDHDFFDKHEYIYVYTPDMIRIYQIFSARYYDDRDLMKAFDFTDKSVYQNFLDDIFSTRDIVHFVRDGVSVTNEDRIITLSTCISGQPENRYLIHGKLIWEGNEEQLAAAKAETENEEEHLNITTEEENSVEEENPEIPEATE